MYGSKSLIETEERAFLITTIYKLNLSEKEKF